MVSILQKKLGFGSGSRQSYSFSVFLTCIDELRYVADRWWMDYNHYRPHSSLGYRTPAGFAGRCCQAGCVRPQTPVLDGVQGGGILSRTLDQKKETDHDISETKRLYVNIESVFEQRTESDAVNRAP